MFQRIMGVFKLDKATFAEIEGDQSATSQAAIVVVLVALVAGIGAAVAAVEQLKELVSSGRLPR